MAMPLFLFLEIESVMPVFLALLARVDSVRK